MDTNEEQLMQCKGWQAINRMGAFNEMYYTMIENYRELVYEIVRIQNSPQSIVELVENKKLTRCVFNFLASVKALTDNCYKMMQFYKGTDLYDKYKNKIDGLLANNPMIAFIQKLRNHQTHFKLEFPELSNSNEVIFATQQLLKYPEQWNKLSKEYMQQCGDEIVLKILCEDYFKLMEHFNMWLYEELKEFHRQDFEEYKLLAAKCNMPIPKTTIMPD